MCAFTLDAAEESFSGAFKAQSSASSVWQSHHSTRSRSLCRRSSSSPGGNGGEGGDGEEEEGGGGGGGGSGHSLLEAEKFQLMDDAVQPTRNMPLLRKGPP